MAHEAERIQRRRRRAQAPLCTDKSVVDGCNGSVSILFVDADVLILMEAAHRQPYDFVLAGDPRTYGDLTHPDELAKIARFAQGIGPSKRLIVPAKADRTLAAPTTLVADAHRAGLLVHPYTFRDEPIFLAPDYAADPQAEYLQFFRLGVDAVFSDFPDSAFRARARYLSERSSAP